MFRLERVLVSVDFSPSSREVLGALTLLELPRGSTVLLVHVVPDLPSAVSSYLKGSQVRQIQKSVEEKAAGMLEELAAAELGPGVTREVLIGRGNPARCILKLARERRTNLIVLGSSDQSKEAGFRFGSTAEKVAQSAPCPVLIVPVGGI